ncbi:hypothetical protein Pan97_38540 [Bremerella volcania]|uniref:Urease accessory protein UreH-like transmembrane domain-containing protein n=1 Tax=Bremerella volcania TaxID=2527984 RepID=A0A518CC52_9BACT|nr:sulfite exporter TauE/SafE family protein [Bremerella volcania]QDU76797.1 hypothetical protein Pan97_38540 [Bremerella volcania]
MEAVSIGLIILTASLAGSGHCVGMCGPFAILAGQSNTSSFARRSLAVGNYHLGRLLTYLLLGIIAGSAGSLVDLGGSAMGLQRLAAWITGSIMIAYGLFAILRFSRLGSLHFALPEKIGSLVQKAFRWTGRLSGNTKALAIGGITAWLPCGWLYAFVLIALGTSSPWSGLFVMLIFWLGTIPLLSVFVFGIQKLSQPWKKWLPVATAVLLIVSGVFTLSVRAQAVFDTLEVNLSQSQTTTEAIQTVNTTPLPCCHCETACE